MRYSYRYLNYLISGQKYSVISSVILPFVPEHKVSNRKSYFKEGDDHKA
jgi:hypothetical protein